MPKVYTQFFTCSGYLLHDYCKLIFGKGIQISKCMHKEHVLQNSQHSCWHMGHAILANCGFVAAQLCFQNCFLVARLLKCLRLRPHPLFTCPFKFLHHHHHHYPMADDSIISALYWSSLPPASLFINLSSKSQE